MSRGAPTDRAPDATRLWTEDWVAARRHHLEWWAGTGLVFHVTSPKDEPSVRLDPPPVPDSVEKRWYDPEYRSRKAEYELSRTWFGADALPIARGWSAAGDLGTFLGARVELDENTVWMYPCIDDPDADEPIVFDHENAWVRKNRALIERIVADADGRYFVGVPDLVENIDVLASLRGTEELLFDMIDRPAWVERRLGEINAAFDSALELFRGIVADAEGGNTFVFNIWGPGRTAKVQCDACSMFGPDMFRRFVAPPLTEQCRRLEYAMYHLDGEQCLPNLDPLLEIEKISAIEWTPVRVSLGEGGGHPMWYDLYRKILVAGKSVQAIGVKPAEVIPLLDACGPAGMFITCHAETEREARELAQKVDTYRE